MQTITPQTEADMQQQTVQALPEAIFEFNHTLLSELTVNSPEGKDEVLFPRESVIEQRYVNSGLPRGIVGQADTMDLGEAIMYRVVSEEDQYQYWVSPDLSTGTSPDGIRPITNAWMEVVYDRDRPTNKIEAVFDVSFARPVWVDIDIRQGGSWTRVATGVAPSAGNGVLTIYAQPGGVWTTDYNDEERYDVGGVRVTVERMHRNNVYAHFISIAAKLRVNMTDKIVNFDVSKSLDNASVLAPIGDSSSQSLDITLDNEDGQFDPQNEASDYYDLLSRNVRIDTSIRVENNPPISQGTFYTESWSYSAPGVEIGTTASDVTRFMQEVYLPQFVLRNYRVHEAVADILARAGFKVDLFIMNKSPVVPYIWYNEEVTVWQALKDLANATLSYFFVDEQGKFIWLDFDSLTERNPALVLDATENLIDLSHNFDVLSNHVTVLHNLYGTPVDEVTKEPVTQEVWGPGEDVALLSMPLKSTLTSTSSYLTLDATAQEMDLWPDEGVIAVQGEYMRYTAKDRALRRLSGMQRAALDSVAKTHPVNNIGTRASQGTTPGSFKVLGGNLRITSSSKSPRTSYNYSLHGNSSTQKTVYGTRVRIPYNSGHESAGLVIHHSGGWSGIYVELSSTRYASKANQNEIYVYRRNSAGDGNVIKSAPYEIAQGNWYDIEITVSYTATNPAYSVYVNGMLVTSFSLSVHTQGVWGPFVRGYSAADFARIYSSDSGNVKVGGTRYQDQIAGANFQSDFIYNSGDPYIEVNEFTPQVRQVKEYNVDYSKFPTTASSIFNSNQWQARVFNFTPGPFGAHFFIENKSDFTAVLNGSSPNLFPEATQMTLIAVGDPVVVESEERRVAKDELSVRRNGRVELEVSNPWIQTEEMADNVLEMIVENFSDPMDTIDVTVFPNYALQIGDVVSVSYVERGYRVETHLYYVLSISTTWRDGFGQSMTLRRKS